MVVEHPRAGFPLHRLNVAVAQLERMLPSDKVKYRVNAVLGYRLAGGSTVSTGGVCFCRCENFGFRCHAQPVDGDPCLAHPNQEDVVGHG